MKNGEYGENTWLSWRLGFGIATLVGNDTGSIGGGAWYGLGGGSGGGLSLPPCEPLPSCAKILETVLGVILVSVT